MQRNYLLVLAVALCCFTGALGAKKLRPILPLEKTCNFLLTSNEDLTYDENGFPSSSIFAFGDYINNTDRKEALKAKLSDDLADNNIATIEFSGQCKGAKLRLWKNEKFSGASIKYNLVKNEGKITLNKFWRRNVSSYIFKF